MGRRYQSVDNFVKNYCKKVEKGLNDALAYTAQKVEEDFLRVSKSVMDNYYNDYDPVIYERMGERDDISGSLRDAFRGINEKTKNGYSAGVYFDFQLMDHLGVTHTGEYHIMENFMKGVHGSPSVKVTVPGAWEVLEKYYDQYETRLDKHYEDGLSKFFNF